MSGLIHFTSGKELPISEYEFDTMATMLNARGIRTRTIKSSGHILPMNSTTIEYIEHIEEAEEEIVVKEITTIPKQDVQVDRTKPKTAEETLAEMTAKSNCKHEPEKLELYVQQTAKGQRYFPVCNFCGKRERYISEKKIADGAYEGTPNERWTVDDIPLAKSWIED